VRNCIVVIVILVDWMKMQLVLYVCFLFMPVFHYESHCTYVINAAIKALGLASFTATTDGVISLLVRSIKTECGICLLWFYKGDMQNRSMQTCKNEKIFKRMLRTCIKKHADGNAGLKAFYIFACSCTTHRGFVMFEIS